MITFSKLGNYGRLGNQLFQIASTIGIARKNNTLYTFPEWKYQHVFSNDLPYFPITPPANIYRETSPYYQDIILNNKLDWSLEGYFQSWKYFKDVEEEVRFYFDFPLERVDKVAIHVRRTDYLAAAHVHVVQPITYYLEAMKLFPNEEFTIFSDDIEWCKNNFIGDQFEFSMWNRAEDDFVWMASHKAIIMANSSFSWWAGYLSKKQVVAPKNYVVGETKDDRLLPEWIKL